MSWYRAGLLGGLAIAVLNVTVARTQEFQVTVSPRFWYLFDNFSTGNLKAGGGVKFLESTNTFDIPMYGASASIVTPYLQDTSFTLSVLQGYSSNTGLVSGGNVSPTEVNLVNQNVTEGLHRTDIEATAQTTLTQNIGWIAGVRDERVRIHYTSNITSSIGGPLGVTTLTNSIPFLDGYDLYSIRGGATGVFPVTSAGNLRMYGAALAFVGYRNPVMNNPDRFDKAWYIGPDLSVGFQWSFTERFALDARYRAILFFPVSGSVPIGDPRVTHGLVLAMHVQF